MGKETRSSEQALKDLCAPNEIVVDQSTATGHGIVSFAPIKDEKQQVSQVATIAVESTQQVMLAECLRTLMDRLPQVRDQVSWAYLSSQKQTVDPSLLAQSAEKLEQCVRAMQHLWGLVEAIAPSSSGKDEDSRQSLLPYVAPTAPSESGNWARDRGPITEIGLAPREVEVVTLLAASRSNKEISNILNITVRTVETYRRRIMLKLQIHSMSELVLYAVRNKLIQP